jgi:hypothetical protein
MSSPRQNRTRVIPSQTVTRSAFQQEFNAANQLAEGLKKTNQVKKQRAQEMGKGATSEIKDIHNTRQTSHNSNNLYHNKTFIIASVVKSEILFELTHCMLYLVRTIFGTVSTMPKAICIL